VAVGAAVAVAAGVVFALAISPLVFRLRGEAFALVHLALLYLFLALHGSPLRRLYFFF